MNSESRSVFIRGLLWAVSCGAGMMIFSATSPIFKPRWRRFAARSSLSGFRRLG